MSQMRLTPRNEGGDAERSRAGASRETANKKNRLQREKFPKMMKQSAAVRRGNIFQASGEFPDSFAFQRFGQRMKRKTADVRLLREFSHFAEVFGVEVGIDLKSLEEGAERELRIADCGLRIGD